ncbi:MAG: zinc ribbon domain-containing protein [Verrucomicrobiales bacterium]|nr:zinc ribbon domain-containing protein [Verrucomicrobiales bacterium]
MAAPENCPNCGADVPRGAKSCPDCGADERTGWSDDAVADRLGIEGSEPFDHEDFARREFGGRARPGRRTAGWGIWWWVALGILVAWVLGMVL